MARSARPWYWKARDGWYVTVNGKRHKLVDGKANEKEAYRRYLAIEPEKIQIETAKLTGQEVCDLYVRHAKANLKPKTFQWYFGLLGRFGATVAKLDANSVKPCHVTDFTNSYPDWNSTSKAAAITAIKRAWQYAYDEGRITLNFLKPMKKPRRLHRDEILDDRETRIFIKAAKPEFREFLMFCYETGCRPGEAAMIERRHVNLGHREVRFRIGEDKTSGRTGKPRVIHLNDAAIATLTKLIAEHGTGPLFRNSRKRPWTNTGICSAVRKIRLRTGLDGRAVAYTLRHHWATDALARGISVAIVAEMMGNSPEVVAKVYSHLADKKQLLLDAANHVRPTDAGN